jgi:hypothetical protein
MDGRSLNRRTLAACALVLSSCVPPPHSGKPPIPPMKCPTLPRPPDKPEPVPTKPATGKNLFLEPGHWEWGDGAYNRVPPAWVEGPGTKHPRWLDGYWTPDAGACVWTFGQLLP